MVNRTLSNGMKMTDWTQEVNEVPNQYGLFNGKALFTGQGISQTSVIFDKNTITTTLIAQSSRKANTTTWGQDRAVETFAIACPYFNHKDAVYPDDVQGWRKSGTPDQAEDLGSVIADKIEDMRNVADQTREYMKIQAIKGLTKDPGGTTIADMYTEFGVSQNTIDLATGTAATKIDNKISELKRYVAKNAKAGGVLGKIEIACSPELFDAIVTHPQVREAYAYYTAQVNPNRDDMATYEKWGIVDTFDYKRVMIYSYDAEFTLPAGTTARAFGTADSAITKQEGYSIVTGMKGLYRAYFGPQNTLSGANSVGSEIYLAQYRDPKDKFIELELEMSPLYILTKPLVSVKLYTTT